MMKRCGFTLVELMVVGLIFTLISLAIFGVLSVGRQSWCTGSTQVQLQQETRKAMDWMVKGLRESGSTHANITESGSIITFQVPVDQDNDGDVLDSSSDVEWGAEGNLGWSIEYSLSNEQILRKVFNNADPRVEQTSKVLANNIRSDNPPPNALMFIGSPGVNPTGISIEVTAEKDAVPGRTMQSTLNSQVTLRN